GSARAGEQAAKLRATCPKLRRAAPPTRPPRPPAWRAARWRRPKPSSTQPRPSPRGTASSRTTWTAPGETMIGGNRPDTFACEPGFGQDTVINFQTNKDVLQTKAGEVRLRVPKLRRQAFETAIIERYRQRESSVEEALNKTAWRQRAAMFSPRDVTKLLGIDALLSDTSPQGNSRRHDRMMALWTEAKKLRKSLGDREAEAITRRSYGCGQVLRPRDDDIG